MKFTTSNFCNLFSIEVGQSFLNHTRPLDFDGPTVSVENFRMLRVLVLELAQLEPVVFTKSIHFAVTSKIASLLESKRKLLYLYLRERFDQSGLISMDIVVGSQLSCIVVSPSEHISMVILRDNKASSHCNCFDAVLKLGFYDRCGNARLKKRSKLLDCCY